MGSCLSCLGRARRDYHDAESSRLLDDDLYPGGYGYGSVNHPNQHNIDPEDVKREREALEAICQRASDSVVDIWALQPQPTLQPQATLRSNGSASSRAASNETTTPVPTDADGPATPQPGSRPTTASSTPGQQRLAAVPKHWGEVVISPRRKGKKTSAARPGQNDNNDFFGVLKVT